MEKIRQRSMAAFILSSLINVGIGLAFGLIISIIAIIAAKGYGAWAILLSTTGASIAYVALLTANIYRMFFYYRLSLDVDALCEGDGCETESYAVALVLSMLTGGIYNLFWTYKLATRLRANAPRYGYKIVETGKDIVVLNAFSLGFVGTYELIKNMNRIAKVYNQNGLAEVGGAN